MAASLRVDHRVEPTPLGGTANDAAETYHENSKYAPARLPWLLRNHHRFEAWLDAQPFVLRPGKTYPGAPRVALPKPKRLRRSLEHAMSRRSSRLPGPGPIAVRALATLVHAGFGVRADGHRTTPSAGGLLPLECYLAVQQSGTGLASGVHHYDPYNHALARIAERAETQQWLLDGERFRNASALIVVTAVHARTRVKYAERSYRFVHLEAGHAVQNVQLAAAALGCAAVPVGGYYDDRVHDALALDGVEETVLYLVALGR